MSVQNLPSGEECGKLVARIQILDRGVSQSRMRDSERGRRSTVGIFVVVLDNSERGTRRKKIKLGVWALPLTSCSAGARDFLSLTVGFSTKCGFCFLFLRVRFFSETRIRLLGNSAL